jgi:hypothetical protein
MVPAIYPGARMIVDPGTRKEKVGLRMDDASHPTGTVASLRSQVDNLREWNRNYGWGFEESQIIDSVGSLCSADPDSSQNPRHAHVVTVTMATAGSTFDTWWQVISGVYPGAHRFRGIYSDPHHLRLYSGRDFTPRCIRVTTVDLLAHWDEEVRTNAADTRSSASADMEVLAAVAHFPHWVMGFSQLLIDLSGYEITDEEVEPGAWNCVPDLTWQKSTFPAGTPGIFLGTAALHGEIARTARPVRLE